MSKTSSCSPRMSRSSTPFDNHRNGVNAEPMVPVKSPCLRYKFFARSCSCFKACQQLFLMTKPCRDQVSRRPVSLGTRIAQSSGHSPSMDASSLLFEGSLDSHLRRRIYKSSRTALQPTSETSTAPLLKRRHVLLLRMVMLRSALLLPRTN